MFLLHFAFCGESFPFDEVETEFPLLSVHKPKHLIATREARHPAGDHFIDRRAVLICAFVESLRLISAHLSLEINSSSHNANKILKACFTEGASRVAR